MSLQLTDLCKTYTSRAGSIRALDGVSLSVELGEVVALVGNNGAGKSTLMSIVAGLLPADSGTATVMGHVTTDNGGTPTHHLGLAPQEEALYPTLTVGQNLQYFGSLAGLRGAALQERSANVASDLLLADLVDRKALELSGGQRRRLHTGLALMHAPEVLLLDEPTVGVDIDARLQLLDFVRDSASGGAAVLYSTHQLTEVEQIATRAIVLDQGKVLAAGSVTDLVERYSPHLVELRFAADQVDLPEAMGDEVDLVRRTGSGELVVVVRVEDGSVMIADIVALLDEAARSRLLSAELHRPSFENAYVRITRRGSAGEPVGEVA
jgi:ABC-2 type transport system ATP-binding protein